MKKYTCLCLQCGRGFDMVLAEGADLEKEKCPVCGGVNIIEHSPRDFFNQLFGRIGGG